MWSFLDRVQSMELLLNVAWLFLMLPAYWLWCAGRSASRGRDQNQFYYLLALGCMLVLLFPVISASDDVCAMQDCREESASTIRQASNEKPSGYKWYASPALPGATYSAIEYGEAWQALPIQVLCKSIPVIVDRSGRAPPTTSVQA
jgi:hypothetical protein